MKCERNLLVIAMVAIASCLYIEEILSYNLDPTCNTCSVNYLGTDDRGNRHYRS